MGLNLYLLTQEDNNGYDTYDSCVVAAASPEDAVLIDPGGDVWSAKTSQWKSDLWSHGLGSRTWAKSPASVKTKLVGVAAEGVTGVVCASFNAG
jgi:hypothetical protein